MKILVYHGKYGADYWVVDTPARMNAALKALFNQLDKYGCYEDEDEDHLAKARAGDKRAIFGILSSRQCCEYEHWNIVEAIDPCK